MKILRYLVAVLCLSGAGFAQAGWYGSTALGMTYSNGIRVAQPLPGATIMVCTTVSTCDMDHLATIYTGSDGGTPAQNPFTADNQGNFGFWALGGNYQYTFSYKGAAHGPFLVTVGANDGGVVHNYGNESITGQKTFTDTIFGNLTGDTTGTHHGPVVGDVTGNLTGNVTGNISGIASVKSMNNIRFADQYAGATADVKINAAIADLPAGGGTVDARGFGATSQTIAATVFVGANSGSGKTVTLLVDRTTTFTCTITNNTPCWVRYAGSSILGMGSVPNPNAGFTLSASAAVANVLLTQDNQGLNLVGGTIEGLFITGHAGATVGDAIFGIQNALQVTQISDVTVAANGTNNVIVLKIYGTTGVNVGNVQFNNIQVDALGSTNAKPVWIGCAAAGSTTPVTCASVNTVTFLGASALTHPSAGNPIVTIEAQNGSGGTNPVGNIGFYGTQVESSSNTDIGILVNGAESVHVYGLYGSCRTTCGADLIKLSQPAGTVLDGIDIRGVDNQGGWTNTLNNTVLSTTFPWSGSPRLNYSYSATSLAHKQDVIEGRAILFGAGSGVSGDGAGFKHKRFGGTTATAASANATQTTTYSWTTAFPDANYTPTCTPGGAITGTPVFQGITSFNAAGVTVQVMAATAAASSFGGVECHAIHD